MPGEAASPFDRGHQVDESQFKGTDDSSGSGVGGRATGGPDAFGYTFADTAEASCTYQWIDISGTGTSVALGDDAGASVALSEAMSLYDSTMNSVGFNSNGFLSSTDDAGGDLTNDCPLPASPSTGSGARICGVHDDLVTSTGYHEYFAACPRPDSTGAGSCTVFLWDEAVHYGNTGVPFDFEIILYHGSGEMVVQWDDRNPEAGDSSTTGIQNAAADIGLTYVCDTAASLPADAGVCFSMPTLGGDLEVTLTSAAGNLALNEPFTWDLGAANLGGGTQTNVVVTGTYPASVTVSGTSCGATAAGGTITWNVGTLADGAGDTCTVNATLTSCAAVPLTAAIAGDDFDPPANNTATLDISISGGEAINDGGFESGTPSAGWAEASTNYGTPICDVAGCGTGTGTGPRTGDFWAWFGGAGGAFEEGSVSQAVTIDPGASIDFWLEAIVCDSAADYVELTIDGNQVWSLDGGSALCGSLGYTMQTVSLAGYDDGASHTLAFHSECFGNSGGGSNFFIDDVSMMSSCDTYQPPQLEAIPTVGRLGLFLMIGLLAVVGIFAIRRFA